jgi:hypothetical protein
MATLVHRWPEIGIAPSANVHSREHGRGPQAPGAAPWASSTAASTVSVASSSNNRRVAAGSRLRREVIEYRDRTDERRALRDKEVPAVQLAVASQAPPCDQTRRALRRLGLMRFHSAASIFAWH